MPSNNAGKWVARAGATGGGRSYRGGVPVNWYAGLVAIVVLGVLSVVFSNYEYRHKTTAGTTSVVPRVGTTWHAALDFDICGTQAPNLAANSTPSTSKAKAPAFYSTGNGVLTIAPTASTNSGKNAVFGKFVDSYHGLVVTSTRLVIPTGSKTVTYKNGEKCKKGTPDAGKTADVVMYNYTKGLTNKAKPTVVTANLATVPFVDNQEITVGFVPTNSKPKKPTGKIILALVQATSGANSSATSTTLTSGSPTASVTVTVPSTVATSPTTTPTTAAPATPATTTPTTKAPSKPST